jgi:hypothetical protein
MKTLNPFDSTSASKFPIIGRYSLNVNIAAPVVMALQIGPQNTEIAIFLKK